MPTELQLRPSSEPLTESGEELFFSDAQKVRINIDPALPRNPLIIGRLHQYLRERFQTVVMRNQRCLVLAKVNSHGFDHMDAVANGVWTIGHALGIEYQDVAAATVAARFHDIGYDFPHDATSEEIAKMGKEKHAAHARNGAQMFVRALEDAPAGVLPRWWKPSHTDIAHDAILLHSTQSDDTGTRTNPKHRAVALLPLIADKLDNAERRVFSSHIEAIRSTLGFTTNYLRYQVNDIMTLTPKPEAIRRHRKSVDEAFEGVAAAHPTFGHQIAPYAITHQHIELDKSTGAMQVRYTVHPGRVSDLMQISYEPEIFMEHFDEALTRTMRKAADAIKAVADLVPGVRAYEHESPLTVHFEFDNGSMVTRQYAGTAA